VPLLWSTTSGADVMKRIAAPMVGGLITSAFLTLEIIPVIYTYWRQEQLLWQRLAHLAPDRLRSLQRWRSVLATGAGLAAALLVSRIYVDFPVSGAAAWLFPALLATAIAGFTLGTGAYLRARPAARRLVWPAPI
jgi:hypothetical protein